MKKDITSHYIETYLGSSHDVVRAIVVKRVALKEVRSGGGRARKVQHGAELGEGELKFHCGALLGSCRGVGEDAR